jgi:hypothetical protein
MERRWLVVQFFIWENPNMTTTTTATAPTPTRITITVPAGVSITDADVEKLIQQQFEQGANEVAVDITPTAAELTFLLRHAPKRSAYAGHLCAELRATSRHQKILKTLFDMELWHPTEECEINVLETWRSPNNTYRILRFTASVEVYRLLHSVCSPGDEDFARITDAHLAELSIPVAIEELVKHSKTELKGMAAVIDADYGSIIGRNPNKKKLAEFICGHAVAA